MFHCNLNWMLRYCLIARNFWLTLWAHHYSWTLQRGKDVFRAHFLYCLVMTSKKKSWQISLPAYWTLKGLNVAKILAVKYTTYAAAQRKPDKTKNSGLPRFEPWPLGYRCSALTNTYYIAIGRYPIPHIYILLCLLTFTVYTFSTLSVKYGLCT